MDALSFEDAFASGSDEHRRWEGRTKQNSFDMLSLPWTTERKQVQSVLEIGHRIMYDLRTTI